MKYSCVSQKGRIQGQEMGYAKKGSIENQNICKKCLSEWCWLNPHTCSSCSGEDRGICRVPSAQSSRLSWPAALDGNPTCATMLKSRSSCSSMGISGVTSTDYNTLLCILPCVGFVHNTKERTACERVQAAILYQTQMLWRNGSCLDESWPTGTLHLHTAEQVPQ